MSHPVVYLDTNASIYVMFCADWESNLQGIRWQLHYHCVSLHRVFMLFIYPFRVAGCCYKTVILAYHSWMN